jgi:glycyl-tRNA synthetase beta chain
MPSLLLEIGAEELPAAACREAEAQLPDLARAHIGAAPSQLFVGPRRFGFLIDALAERTADEWVKGPPENLRDKAAAGFAKKHGVNVDELELRDGFLGITVPGRRLREVLPEQIDRIVRGFSFTRSMRWDESGIRFARPVRWVLAKLDDETIVGETSFGHRFTHGAVAIPSAAGYVNALRAADVEPVAEERLREIVEGLDAIGGWSDPGGKLDEVVHLVE